MKKRATNITISIIIGATIFFIFFYHLGPKAISIIIKNLNPVYIALFFISSFLVFILATLRWQIVLKAYRKKVPFWTIFRQRLAGHAISYITPATQIGGEPVRAYMLKKELNIDIKTGTASIIIERFIELTGMMLFGLVGVITLIYIPGIPTGLKIGLTVLIGIGTVFLSTFYYRTITHAGSLSTLFNLFRLHKIPRFENLPKVLINIEKKMHKFFINHKKHFILSCLTYLVYLVFLVLESKFLLLGIGINAPLSLIILAINIHGLVAFIPIPAGLGAYEAGESGLFELLGKTSAVGIAYTLIKRINDLFFASLGFASISYFSGKQIQKKLLHEKNNYLLSST